MMILNSGSKGIAYLIILYIGICLTIIYRNYVESTTYTSPDSSFYLVVTENIISGKGPIGPATYPFDQSTEESFFAIWPLGYPYLIATASKLTGANVLIASKLVNLIFLGFIFILLYVWIGDMAWFPTLYFCSFGMLEIYSYTWSEGVFLFFSIYLCFLLYRKLYETQSYFIPQLVFCLVSLALIRYAGIIYFFIVGYFFIHSWINGKFRIRNQLFIGLLLSSLVVLFYLFNNYLRTGFFTGAHRLYPEIESFGHFIINLGQGVVNEFTITRNYYFTNYFDGYYLFFLGLQLILFVFLFVKSRKSKITSLLENQSAYILVFSGICYLIFIIILRKLSPFESFDYRILAPFSMPVYFGLLMHLVQPENKQFFKKTNRPIAVFMLLSLFFNLPKDYTISLILNLFTST